MTISLKNSIKNTGFERKTISISPLRNSPVTPLISSRGSVPRSYKSSEKSSVKKILPIFEKKLDSVRFLTGERLQPMFKKEFLKSKQTNKRKIYDAGQIKETNGKSVDYTQEKSLKNTEDNETTEEIRVSNEDSKDFQELSDIKDNLTLNDISSERKTEKINAGTQVDIFERNLFKRLKNNAAIVIQKYCRGFLAKKRFVYEKYSKQLEDAENQAKIAKEKLSFLRKFERKTVNLQPADLVPIAYKDKILSLNTSASKGLQITKRPSVLTTITEENNYPDKIITIQS